MDRIMKIIKLTKSDLDQDNFYNKEEIGKWNEYENVSVEIDENLDWVKFKKGLYVNGSISAKAGSGIKAGEGIEAGWGIKAGSGIEAGWVIKAGSGIKAGEGIVCKFVLSFKYNLFAGVALWKKAEGVDKKIVCGKLESGTIAYGDLEEVGMPDEIKEEVSLSGKEVEVNVDGKVYKAVIK